MDGRGVLRSVAQGALTAFCRFGLPESYVRSQLQGSVYADDADEDTNVLKQQTVIKHHIFYGRHI